MVSDISPFQRLLTLSENFQEALDKSNGAIKTLFIRSVETPANAFISCPNTFSRFFYQLLGSIRKILRLDTIRRYDQQANIQIIQALFKQALNDLPNHKNEDVAKVIRFGTLSDIFDGTDTGKNIFASYLLGSPTNHLLEFQNKTPVAIFHSCLNSLKETSKPAEALKRICILFSALKCDLKATREIADHLLAHEILADANPISTWIEELKRLEEVGITLPDSAESCDAILEKATIPISREALSAIFLEHLSPQQFEKACFLTDDLYVAKITTLQTILTVCAEIKSLKSHPPQIVLPKTTTAIVEKLITEKETSLSDRYRIFQEVEEFLSEEQHTRIARAWIGEYDQAKEPLKGILEQLKQINASKKLLRLKIDAFEVVLENYKLWLHDKYQAISGLKIEERAQKLADFTTSQAEQIQNISKICPGEIQDILAKRLQSFNSTEISPILSKIQKELEITKKSYEEALQTHHVLTAMTGELLRIPNSTEQLACLEKIHALLKELDTYLEQKNPGAHVSKEEKA